MLINGMSLFFLIYLRSYLIMLYYKLFQLNNLFSYFVEFLNGVKNSYFDRILISYLANYSYDYYANIGY